MAAPVADAPIPRNFVQPHGQRLRILELGKMRYRLQQDFLHGVFGILGMAADFHAEGIDRVLQQSQRPVDGIRVVFAN